MYCAIMAGGSGTRFWPRSRENRSKQFLNILGKDSLIQSTVKRFSSFVNKDKLYIVAKESQREELEKHNLSIPDSNVIYEPFGKNTAPCIGLAAVTIRKKDPEAVMIVSPADHLIKDIKAFQKAVKTGCKIAQQEDGLVTIGITPTRPATGYGYIQIHGDPVAKNGAEAYQVKTFAEKPNLATAQRFLKSGDFFWNSGIFIFRVSVFLENVKAYLPNLYDSLMEIEKSIGKPKYPKTAKRVYKQIKTISIDYGIMEKAKNVFLVEGRFPWNDLGSWEEVYNLSSKDQNGNYMNGKVVLLDTKNSFVKSNQGLVAVLGCEDLVVVQEGDATLICKRERVEEVKHIVEKIKRSDLKTYS